MPATSGSAPSGNPPPTIQLAKFRPSPNSLHNPSDVLHTSRIPAGSHGRAREIYLEHIDDHPAPIIAKSPFVPLALAEHLLRNKRNSALATKYLLRTAITNMEGALHTFVTPLVRIEMVGDYAFRNGHSVLVFPSVNGKQQVRRCVLSATIHPDFEDYDVGHALYCLGPSEVRGTAELPSDFTIPSKEAKLNAATRAVYDEQIRSLLVYHLTASHSLPPASACKPWSQAVAATLLRKDLESEIDQPMFVGLVGKTVDARPAPLSLEMLVNTYACSLANEFSALEALCPQGYAYTYDPPSIFAATFSAELLNLLFIHALRNLARTNPLPGLRIFAFNDYADPSLLPLVKRALRPSQPHVLVISRAQLFLQGGYLDTTL